MKQKGRRIVAVMLVLMLMSVATFAVHAAGSNDISGTISTGAYGGTVTSYTRSGYASMWGEPYDSWNEIYVRISGWLCDSGENEIAWLSAEGGNQCSDSASVSTTQSVYYTECMYYAEGTYVGIRTAYT